MLLRLPRSSSYSGRPSLPLARGAGHAGSSMEHCKCNNYKRSSKGAISAPRLITEHMYDIYCLAILFSILARNPASSWCECTRTHARVCCVTLIFAWPPRTPKRRGSKARGRSSASLRKNAG